jgi:hypothetical protein
MRRGSIVVVVMAAAIVLAGCAPTPGATRSASASRSAAPTTAAPQPTASASPLPDGVLFQITATATAPDGTIAKLTETVNAPAAQTDHQAGDETQLDHECDGWRQAFPSTQFLVATVTTTIPAGASWTDTDGQITMDMAGYPVWSGDQRPSQELCATAIAIIPGSARAVSPVAAGKPDATGGWAVFRYGFGVPTTPGAGSAGATATPAASGSGVVFSRCTIQLGAAAASSIFASAWATHPDTENGSACRFGGTGS